MVPIPVIEVGEGEFKLNTFLRAYWYLFVFISLFAALSVILTFSFSDLTKGESFIDVLGIPFNLQEISIAASLLITFLGVFAVLWAAFAEPRDKPIFYYFIGIEAFKRLLLVIPLVVLIIALVTWISITFSEVLTVIFSLVSFCLGIVIFSSILVLISRNTSIRRIVLATMTYALIVFCLSLAFLLCIDLRSISQLSIPLVYFVYAMGIASVFYVIANLIFEIILPLFQRI